MLRSLFLVALLVSGGLTPANLFAADEIIKGDDGTQLSKVALDADGKRHGAFTAWFPGGKKVAEKSQYAHGKLNGKRLCFDPKGRPTADETWLDGSLIFPRSIAFIDATRKQIAIDTAPAMAALGPLTDIVGAAKPKDLELALIRIRTYRYLCFVPYEDITFNREYINLAQHAASLLVKIGSLTHTPTKPAGVEDAFFALAAKGCGESNLCQGSDLAGSVDRYMNDSDPSNIDRIGHRRWLLNPGMQQTGLGIEGAFSALYAFDQKRAAIPDYEFVSYPPRGYCPHDLFDASYAWHASFNPAHYDVPATATMAIYPLNAQLKRTGKALETDYAKVNLDGFGIPNAVISRPKTVSLSKNASYEVVVSGLVPKGERTAEVSYIVSFY